MVSNRCPCCGQLIPIQNRSEILASIEAYQNKLVKENEKKFRKQIENKLKKEFNMKTKEFLKKQKTLLEKSAEKKAEAKYQPEISKLQRIIEKKEENIEQIKIEAETIGFEKAQSQIQILQKEKSDALKALEETKRKLQLKDSDFNGVNAQREVEDILRQSFPNDLIHPRKRGAEDPDIRQEIREAGKIIGCVVYEVKNEKQWKNDFIKQARNYQNKFNANHAIVVSSIFPEGENLLCFRGETVIVSPRLVAYIVRILREMLVEIDKLKIDEREAKQQEILRYLQSEEFKQKFRSVNDAIQQLNDILSDEKRKASTRWDKQIRLYDQIRASVDSVDNNVVRILQKPMEKINIEIPKKRRIKFLESTH